MTTPQRISPWLKTALITAGHLTESGLSRRAQLRTCPRCRTPILTGLDNDLAALEATADLTDLSAPGETAAITAGLNTYELRHTLGRLELTRRDHWAIKSRPAGQQTTVLAQHTCHQPTPTTWAAPPPPGAAQPPATSEDPNECPF